MKQPSLLLALTLAAAIAPTAYADVFDSIQHSIERIARRAAPGVVALRAERPTAPPPIGFTGFGWSGMGFQMSTPLLTTTGFVWDRKGCLVTAPTLPAGSGVLHALLPDGGAAGAYWGGRGHGRDPLHVLKVDRLDLVPLPVGDSRSVKVGTVVVVMAAAGSDRPAPYPCIISAVEGEDEPGFRLSCIPGNGAAGAPVLNSRGEVIGVVLGRAGSQDGSGSAGAALPIHAARPAIERILATPPPGYLGIVRPSSGRWTAGGAGARVGATVPDGPAERAGILPGDVLLEIAGQRVADDNGLFERVRGLVPGKEITIRIERGSARRELRLTPAIAPVLPSWESL